MVKYFAVLTLLLLYPFPSYAYIDPGILAMATQGFFALVAGIVTAWVIAPWHKIKVFFCKLTGKEPPSPPYTETDDDSEPPTNESNDDEHQTKT